MPELLGARALQQLFDAWPGLFHLLVRLHPRSWRALAKIIRGERGFHDVGRILQRHPALVRVALRTGQRLGHWGNTYPLGTTTRPPSVT